MLCHGYMKIKKDFLIACRIMVLLSSHSTLQIQADCLACHFFIQQKLQPDHTFCLEEMSN